MPPELLLLFPLAVAAGLDLYLTVLLLAAAPTVPWLSGSLPGALGDLDTPWVVVVVGGLYLAEFVAERTGAGDLAWNGPHLLVRPLSGALLAALLLQGTEPSVWISACVGGAALTALVHAVRTGSHLLRWLDTSDDPHPLLISLFEDTIVLGLVAATLDVPRAATAFALVALGLGLPRSGSRLRALAFVGRAAFARGSEPIEKGRWLRAGELPMGALLGLGEDPVQPDVSLRGTPAAGLRLSGLPHFSLGWLVVTGSGPVFVRQGGRGRRRTTVLERGSDAPVVHETGLWRTAELASDTDGTTRIFTLRSGPGASSLSAELAGARTPDPVASRNPPRDEALSSPPEKNL